MIGDAGILEIIGAGGIFQIRRGEFTRPVSGKIFPLAASLEEIDEQNFKIQNPRKITAPIDSLRLDNRDLDIGEETIDLFTRKIFTAQTIFWNGPVGDINDEKFAKGSLAVAKAIIASGAYSIVGGGDTVGFLGENDLRDKFNFVSTGGGAMLVFLSGNPLPGLSALSLNHGKN